jgi:decaprenylphospho-beta-D-erythro-pentofuranosid-2-ulose 2-reductase
MSLEKIIIFGATSKIACSIAKIYAENNASLFLIGRNEEKLNIVATDLMARGANNVDILAWDLTDVTTHSQIHREIEKKFGTYTTVLVAYGSLSDQEKCQSDSNYALQEIAINFTSVVSLLTPIINLFESRNSGTIAIIGSPAGDRGRKSNYIYGCAKGGLDIFIQGVQHRLANTTVKVVFLKPGFVSTPMTSHLNQNGLLWSSAEKVGNLSYFSIFKGKSQSYVPGFWRLIMIIIKNLPQKILHKTNL